MTGVIGLLYWLMSGVMASMVVLVIGYIFNSNFFIGLMPLAFSLSIILGVMFGEYTDYIIKEA